MLSKIRVMRNSWPFSISVSVRIDARDVAPPKRLFFRVQSYFGRIDFRGAKL